MTAIIRHPPASMSSVASYVYPDHHTQHPRFRPPLSQLPKHNSSVQPYNFTGTIQGSENEIAYSAKEPRIMGGGGIYRSGVQNGGYAGSIAQQPSHQISQSTIHQATIHGLQQSSQNTVHNHITNIKPRSPIEEVSPKHVEFKQEPDMYQADTTDQIAPYLQIPLEINSSKGSLSDFAAQITCLFWFESSQTLLRVEEARSTPLPSHPLLPEANPTIGFRKWVTTILSTTQVSTNVVLLALMFVYRLKKMNPSVKGKSGSEYRLLTVALMLGNKFLDDNTYTNKTWAEVSGITVGEIHVMEVEFLSNMRYTLYASKAEWHSWLRKLRRFAEYFDAASRAAEEMQNSIKQSIQQAPPLPLTPSQPAHITTPTRIYATPAKLPGTPTNRLPHPLTTPMYLPQSSSPTASKAMEYASKRKRSYEEDTEERAAKRLPRNLGMNVRPDGISPVPSLVSNASTYEPNTPRTGMYPEQGAPRGLPMPIMTNQQLLPQLPAGYPQMHPSRSMAAVYPPISQAGLELLKPQPQIPPPLGLRIPSLMDPNQPHSTAASRNNSPLASVATPTTELLSPMAFGQYRSSPYKPVRTVNSLLAPPPSASLGNPANGIGSSDLQYRPLGKQLGQSRIGVVPLIPPAYSQQQHWLYHPHQPSY